MGLVRNPGQWGNLSEPFGGSAAGKHCSISTTSTATVCCYFHPKLPRTSHTLIVSCSVQKVPFGHFSSQEKEAKGKDWVWHNPGDINLIACRNAVCIQCYLLDTLLYSWTEIEETECEVILITLLISWEDPHTRGGWSPWENLLIPNFQQLCECKYLLLTGCKTTLWKYVLSCGKGECTWLAW